MYECYVFICVQCVLVWCKWGLEEDAESSGTGVIQCGGLKRNGPHRLTDLNDWTLERGVT